MFDTFMNEVGEQRSYTDMVTELTEGFTAQPGSIMRDHFGTQVKQRLHAARVSQEPYYVKLFNSMGATDAARSREIAIMQMAMTPSGIDALKRNVESAMTYIQQEPGDAAFDMERGVLPADVNKNIEGNPNANESDQLSLFRALLNVQAAFGSQQTGRKNVVAGQQAQAFQQALGPQMQARREANVREEEKVAQRRGEDNDGAFGMRLNNARRLVADEDMRLQMGLVNTGEREAKVAKMQDTITLAMLARIDENAGLQSQNKQRLAATAAILPIGDKAKFAEEFKALGDILGKQSNPAYYSAGERVKAATPNTTFSKLDPVQKFQELFTLGRHNMDDQIRNTPGITQYLEDKQIDRAELESQFEKLSNATGISSVAIANFFDKQYRDAIKNKQTEVLKTLNNATGVSPFIITTLAKDPVPNYYTKALVFPMNYMRTNASKLTDAQVRAIDSLSFGPKGGETIIPFIEQIRKAPDSIVDRYGIRNLSSEEYKGLINSVETLVAENSEQRKKEVGYWDVEALLHTTGAYSRHSPLPSALKASPTVYNLPPTEFPLLITSSLQKLNDMAKKKNAEDRKPMLTFIQSLAIPDAAVELKDIEEEQIQLNNAGMQKPLQDKIGQSSFVEKIQGNDVIMKRTGLDSIFATGDALVVHQMFAPKGDIAPGFLESEFNDGIKNGGFGDRDDSQDNELMASLNRVLSNPAISLPDKYMAVELYNRADYALRRYGLSSQINTLLIQQRSRMMPTELNQTATNIATDELISSMSGFEHIVQRLKAQDQQLDTSKLTRQMHGWTGDKWDIAINKSNYAEIEERKKQVAKGLGLFQQTQLPFEAAKIFEGMQIVGNPAVLRQSITNVGLARNIQNLSVLNTPNFKVTPEMRIQTHNPLTQGQTSRFLHDKVKYSFF